MPTVNLYGANLFGRSSQQSIIKHLNNAPGGIGGVDVDVQNRLGATGAPHMVRHGICCGITLTWIIGFCHGRSDAHSTSEFADYFMNVLRFQGAYLKDFKGNVNALDTLDDIHPQGLTKLGNGKCKPTGLGSNTAAFPAGRWAAYLGVWHHAIGIGGTWGDAKYIMDPNAGLFNYISGSACQADLQDLCEARRVSKGKGPNAEIHYTYFTA